MEIMKIKIVKKYWEYCPFCDEEKMTNFVRLDKEYVLVQCERCKMIKKVRNYSMFV